MRPVFFVQGSLVDALLLSARLGVLFFFVGPVSLGVALVYIPPALINTCSVMRFAFPYSWNPLCRAA